MRAPAFPLWLCLAFVVRGADAPQAPVQFDSLPGVAIYNAGYLFSWDNPKYSQVTLYGRDAKPVYTIDEHKDGIYHSAWAVDSDGVAAGAYEFRGAWEGRIDLFDPTGMLTLTMNTGPYIPEHVVFAPDHTLWTVGYNAGNDGREDFNVLHHYARSGKELGQGLPWSQIGSENNSYTALQALIGGRKLFIGEDRIGFRASTHSGPGTWVETSSTGTFLAKYELGSFERSYAPVAMTAGGRVYARTYKDKSFDGWAELDHSTGTWHKIAGPSEGTIIGSDGENVAFSKREGGWTVLHLVSSASLRH